jgi:hypothetical protein
MQQTDRQQRRQGKQHTAIGNIRHRLKDRRYRGEVPHAGGQPIQDVAGPHSHRRRGVFATALALGA